jgi:hypothetical protein
MDPSGSGGGRRKKRGGRSGGGAGGGGGNRGSGGGGGHGGGHGGGGGGGGHGGGLGGNKGRRKRKRGRGGNQLSKASLERLPPTATMNDTSILGGRQVAGERTTNELLGDPSAFGLFCAYYLGVTPDDGYQKPSLDETARRYGISHDEVRQLLDEHRLDSESFKATSFDLEGAKLDVRLAPEGMSRIEIARDQYNDYLEQLPEQLPEQLAEQLSEQPAE